MKYSLRKSYYHWVISNEPIKKDAFFYLGCFMVAVVAADIFVNLGDWTELLWFCTGITALLAYGLFRREPRVLTMVMVLAVPAQLPWVFDFLLDLFGYGWGRTAMLRECGPFIYWGSILIHSAAVPVSTWAVHRTGFDKRALWWALAYGTILLLVTFVITPPYKNVNCIFFSCDADDPGQGYVLYFFRNSLLVWEFIVAASYCVLGWIFRRNIYTGGDDAKNS
jgi:hypothetical protein